jgi:hypothetical protein
MTETVTLPIFNLNRAREAAANEAAEKPWCFEFNEHIFEVLPAKQWPLSVSRHLADGRIDLAMEIIMPGDGFDRLVDAGAVMGDLEIIMEAYGEENDLDGSKN